MDLQHRLTLEKDGYVLLPGYMTAELLEELRQTVDALYASARQPKELIWMRGAHVHADSATVRRLVEIVLARVRTD